MNETTYKVQVKSVEQEKSGVDYQAPLPFTAEETEDELILLASKLARQRLMDGTASNQLVAEILRLGTAKERLQKEKLRKENELLAAKTGAIQSQRNTDAFQQEVLRAIKSYAPPSYIEEEDDYDE